MFAPLKESITRLCAQSEYAGKQEAERYNQFYQSVMVDGTLMFPGSLLKRAALLFPDNIALICKDEKITYKELFARSWHITQQLRAAGIKPRDNVCMLFENSIEFYIAYYGIWQTGAVIIPLNIFLHEKELEHILKDARPAALLVGSTLQKKVEEIPPQLKPRIFMQDELQMHISADVDPAKVDIPQFGNDELVALLYTSGTTGFPKGVMLSSRNIMTNIVQGLSRIEATPSDAVLAVLPLFHSFAELVCVWGSFFLGSKVIVVPKIERRYILQGFAQKPTVIMGVPALYGLFVLMKKIPLQDIRYFVSGGDALPDKIATAFELVYRRKICNGYGLTESSPLVAADLQDALKPSSSVGRPVYGVQISIRDEDRNELSSEQNGIIWVKGDNIMLGYYNAPEQTASVIKDGWFDTGDIGYRDDQGRLIITGRFKDVIAHKGIKIYPQEVENVLFTHPAVLKAGVIGVPDPDVGEIPIAYILVTKLEPNLEQELKKLCQEHLAAYKIPREFIIRTSLPLTSLGKVDKKTLKKEYTRSS